MAALGVGFGLCRILNPPGIHRKALQVLSDVGYICTTMKTTAAGLYHFPGKAPETETS